MRDYAILALAIVLEVTGTAFMKAADGFTQWGFAIAMVAAYAASLYLLGILAKRLPLSLVYGIWGGLGTALTAIVGVIIWDDPVNALVISGLILIISGAALLGSEQS